MSLIKCFECQKEISDTVITCPHCGVQVQKFLKKRAKNEKKNVAKLRNKRVLKVAAVIFCLMIIWKILDPIENHNTNQPAVLNSEELTKAEQSAYNDNILLATTSNSLTKADLAWHAQNTYGWDCSEVVFQGELTNENFYLIECANGKKLRVYPRAGKHPRITNINGSYK